uniref:Scpl35 n=1 Tax=Arundo donax TaxID=35708 RepID=A0A0A9EXM7_ARUDO
MSPRPCKSPKANRLPRAEHTTTQARTAVAHRNDHGHGHGIAHVLPSHSVLHGVSRDRRRSMAPAAGGRPRDRPARATAGRVQALRRLRRRRPGRRRQGPVLLVLRGRARAGQEAPPALAQRRARMLLCRLRCCPGAGPVPGQELRH